MNGENYFVPKILLCGDKAEFFAQIGQHPFELVGEVKFVERREDNKFYLLDDRKFLINGQSYDYQDLSVLLTEVVDYIVFNDSLELAIISYTLINFVGCPRSQLVSLEEFKNIPTDAFYDLDSDHQLMIFLKSSGIKTLLDVDAHFAKSQLLTKGANDFTEIDCISEKELLPIKENIYSRVYKKFSDCQFRHYDAALIFGMTDENSAEMFLTLEDMTDTLIMFARYGSDLEKFILGNVNYFDKVAYLQSFAGRWFIFRRDNLPKDFAMYVVTHKKLSDEHVEKLPEGYQIIHAGRAISQDFGYLGDDIGANISHLNPYLNELTALYWIWKNTNHSIIGLSHYRRFFTESEEKPFTEINDKKFSYEKILTEETAIKLLDDCDIIVTRLAQHYTTQFEDIKDNVGLELATFIKITLKEKVTRLYPDYEKTFDYVMNSPTYYECHMFITRKAVFEKYCEWLFSFTLGTFNEVSQKVPIEKFQGQTKRAVGHFIERMMTVWLIKNRLRVKELNKMFVDGI